MTNPELIAFDLDGTLIDIYSSWCWIHDFFGVSNKHNLQTYLRKEIDDIEFMRRDIALWLNIKKNLTIYEIEKIFEPVTLMPGAEECIYRLKLKGYKTAIVSGGIDILANRVAKQLNIDYVLANGLAYNGSGELTGEGILNVELLDKGKSLKNLQNRLGIKPEDTISVGNSFIDVSMFNVSSYGIAFYPADEEIIRYAEFVVRDKDLRMVATVIENNHTLRYD